MPEPLLGKSKKLDDMHYAVGAIISRDDKFLLLERTKIPHGFACPAGHVDFGEEPEEALKREVKEETGLDVVSFNKVAEEEIEGNTCGRQVDTHYWRVYRCETAGEVKKDARESKSMGWFSPEELIELALEPVWGYWLRKLNII